VDKDNLPARTVDCAAHRRTFEQATGLELICKESKSKTGCEDYRGPSKVVQVQKFSSDSARFRNQESLLTSTCIRLAESNIVQDVPSPFMLRSR
jgi:hypothetical protein